MRPYQYQSLRPGEIRLLRLHPAPDPEWDLSGSLIHHELTNPKLHIGTDGQLLKHTLPYEAVSYHWGSNTRTPFTLVIRDEGVDDGTAASVIPLTASLYTLLRQIVYPDKDRVVWVDAICINQVLSTANVEKGEQIRLMPDIYRIAFRTVVYLGPASPDSDLAISFLEHIAEYSEFLDELEPGASFEAAVAAGFDMPADGEAPELEAVRNFWRRPWFRRVWIIQEFVYASELIVLCGSREVDWRRLWLAGKAYAMNPRLSHVGFPVGVAKFALMLLWPRYLRRRIERWIGPLEGARALTTVADLRLRSWGFATGFYAIFNLGQRSERDRWRPLLPLRKDYRALREYEEVQSWRMAEYRSRGNAFPFGKKGLLWLLDASRGFLATQPVDRIYALLGLAGDAAGEEFAPLYSEGQTLPVVSTRIAAGLVRQGLGPQVLSLARLGEQRRDGTPSWVPNWTSVVNSEDRRLVLGRSFAGTNEDETTARFPMDVPEKTETGVGTDQRPGPQPRDGAQEEGHAKEGGKNGEEQPKEEEKEDAGEDEPGRFYKASGDTKFHHRLDEAQGVLYVRAAPMDEVAGLLPGRMTMGTYIHDKLIRAAYPSGTYPFGESIDEALGRTQIANLTFDGKVPGPEYAAMYNVVRQRDVQLLTMLFCGIFGAGAAVSPFILAVVRVLPLWSEVLALSALCCLRPWMRHSVTIAGVLGVLLPVLRWLRWYLALPVLFAAGCRALTCHWYNEFLALLTYLGASCAACPGYLVPEAALFISCLTRIAGKYSLGLTNMSRLLCLFPPEAEPGDVLFLVDGCDAPFVFRRGDRPGLWRVVGECYVHGVMNGEVAGMLSRWEVGLY